MFASLLILIGVYFLLKNAGIIQGDFWGYLWPIVIILLGLSMLEKDKKKDSGWCFWCRPKKKDEHHKVVDEQ